MSDASPDKHPVGSFVFVALSVLTGLMGAFVFPITSFFLIDGLSLQPVYVGVYMIAVTCSGIVISQFLGGLADKGWSSRRLYVLAVSGIMLVLLVYINAHSFWLVLIGGTCFLSVGNACVPQMLTLSRQWVNTLPESRSVNVAQFNGQIRAGISFSWMMGPPLAFFLLPFIGFSGVFSIAIFAGAACILFVLRCVPSQVEEASSSRKVKPESAPMSFWFLAIAVVLGSMGNNMYTSSIPLYTMKELHLPSYTPGVLMGLVAAIEIPVMLLSGRLCRHFKKSTLMMIAFICGLVFYFCVFHSTTFLQLVVLQVINAVFYGLFAGIGLTLMQERLPERIGFTAAVYSNGFKIGVMFGASLMGVIAQFYGFRYVMLGGMCAAVFAFIFMLLFRITLRHEHNDRLVDE